MRGDVIVELFTDRTERLAPGSRLESDHGVLEVVTSRPHLGRWIVRFADHASRDDAEALHGVVLRAEPIDDPDELWVHHLVGAEVRATDGTLVGHCVAVQANPAADLLELDSGALVPVVFVVAHDRDHVVVDLPEDLLDL